MHEALQILLLRRLDLIADHAFRDRDAVAHLAALREVSESIERYAKEHAGDMDGRLRHYLAQSSLQKALQHLQSSL